jgi:predicted ATPase
MQLREVAVCNFRPFASATMRLPGHGLVLVAGANNSGKTAFLSALDAVAGVATETPALRRAGTDSPAVVSATFDLSEAERAEVFSANARKAEVLASGAASQLQFVFQEQSGSLQLAHVRGDWPGRGLEIFATVGAAEDGPGTYGARLIRALRGGQDDVDPLSLVDGEGGQRWGGVVPLEPAINGVRELDFVPPFLSGWRQRYYHFRALRPGSPRSGNLASADRLVPTGENLTAVLLEMLTNRSELFAELGRLMTTIVPLIGQLRVRTSGNAMEAVFVTGDAELNLKDLGTGVEQLLMTLVVGLTETPPFTLVIEEPETNLHHAAQRALLGLLKEWSADRQIIAATHSPVLLDWSPRGERLWHVIKEPDGSTIKPVDADPSELLDSLGVKLSDVLSATRVLVLEGPSDADVLEAWFPEVLRSPAVAVLQGGGGDNARHADRLADWLRGADRIGLRRVLYLRDRDELSPSAAERLEASPTVGLLERRELENYLLDPVAVAQTLGSVMPLGQEPPSADEVAEFMRATAVDLRRNIVVNRVCNQIRPERPLMDHRLRHDLAQQGADEATILAAVSDRLMSENELHAQVQAAWRAADADVASHEAQRLLEIAPGEEILGAVFRRYADRGYSKRQDGVAIAKAMSAPPEEIRALLDTFMAD